MFALAVYALLLTIVGVSFLCGHTGGLRPAPHHIWCQLQYVVFVAAVTCCCLPSALPSAFCSLLYWRRRRSRVVCFCVALFAVGVVVAAAVAVAVCAASAFAAAAFQGLFPGGRAYHFFKCSWLDYRSRQQLPAVDKCACRRWINALA